MISICSALFDINGQFLVEPDIDSDFSFVSRRVSRSATLDGGCVIVDNGYTASDATFTINLTNITELEKYGLLALAQVHNLITISVDKSIFSGAIERIDEQKGLKIRFLVKQQLNEA